MKTINVSFEDAEFEAIDKAKKGQSWREFILERAAIDSSNEIYSKGINADALRGLCLEYDLSSGPFPSDPYIGFALLEFFLVTVAKIKVSRGQEKYIAWEEKIEELRKAKREKNNG